jgi:hypothetical protein
MLQQEETTSEDVEAEVQDACLVSVATHLDAAHPLVAEDEEGRVTTHMLAARDMKILSFAKFVAKEITLLLIVGIGLMNPMSRNRRWLRMPPQAPTKSTQTGMPTSAQPITSPVS